MADARRGSAAPARRPARWSPTWSPAAAATPGLEATARPRSRARSRPRWRRGRSRSGAWGRLLVSDGHDRTRPRALNVTQRDRFPQGRHGIALRDELVREDALIAGC